jgi:hypothetical protein
MVARSVGTTHVAVMCCSVTRTFVSEAAEEVVLRQALRTRDDIEVSRRGDDSSEYVPAGVRRRIGPAAPPIPR